MGLNDDKNEGQNCFDVLLLNTVRHQILLKTAHLLFDNKSTEEHFLENREDWYVR